MAGFLPGTRPLAENYGTTLVDDKPIEDPERELGATQINAMRDDVAYAARMTPLLMVHVLCAGAYVGAPAVAEVRGPEGVVVGDVSVAWQSDGYVQVTITGTGIVATRAHADVNSSTVFASASTYVASTILIHVRTVDALNALETDLDFTLWIY